MPRLQSLDGACAELCLGVSDFPLLSLSFLCSKMSLMVESTSEAFVTVNRGGVG